MVALIDFIILIISTFYYNLISAHFGIPNDIAANFLILKVSTYTKSSL